MFEVLRRFSPLQTPQGNVPVYPIHGSVSRSWPQSQTVLWRHLSMPSRRGLYTAAGCDATAFAAFAAVVVVALLWGSLYDLDDDDGRSSSSSAARQTYPDTHTHRSLQESGGGGGRPRDCGSEAVTAAAVRKISPSKTPQLVNVRRAPKPDIWIV